VCSSDLYKYKIPKLILAIIEPFPKGITAQPANPRNIVKTGAVIKMTGLPLLGITGSFANSLKPSATDCNKPKAPTTLGPFLR